MRSAIFNSQTLFGSGIVAVAIGGRYHFNNTCADKNAALVHKATSALDKQTNVHKTDIKMARAILRKDLENLDDWKTGTLFSRIWYTPPAPMSFAYMVSKLY